MKDVRNKGGRGSAKCGRYCEFLFVKGQNMRTQGEGGQICGRFFMDGRANKNTNYYLIQDILN